MLAGGSEAAVKRAAKHGLGLVLQTNQGGLKELYENECRAHGHEPGVHPAPGRQRSDRGFRRRRRRQGVGRAGPAPAARCGDGRVLPPRRRGGGQHLPRHGRERAARGRTARTGSSPPTRPPTTCARARPYRSHRSAAGCRRTWRGRISSALPRPRPRRLTEGESWRQVRVASSCGRPAVSARSRSTPCTAARISNSSACGCTRRTRWAATPVSSRAANRSASPRPTTPTR